MVRPLVACLLLISACSFAQTKNVKATVRPPVPPRNVLIVYVSRTHNTKAVAGLIHQTVGGTLVALQLQKPYPENYQATVQQVASENENGVGSSFETVKALAPCDTILEGYSTQGGVERDSVLFVIEGNKENRAVNSLR